MVTCAVHPFTVCNDLLEQSRGLGSIPVLAVVSREVQSGVENVRVVGSQRAGQVRQQGLESINCGAGVAALGEVVGQAETCQQGVGVVRAERSLLVSKDDSGLA